MTAKISKLLVAALTALIAGFLYNYLDGRVPEPIPEQWKVKVMDAWMKTYGHTIKWLVRLGITEPFSPLDRYIADLFILTMTTGRPWGLGHDYKVQITDTKIRGVRVKIYQPLTTIKRTDRPVLIYFHGGGWSLLSVDSYDPLMRKISRDSETVVISVELSPQFSYPVPLNDCMDVVEHVIENQASMGIDAKRISIGGDSAGGNMAAAISLRLKKKIAMQLLLVPSLQFSNWNTTAQIENFLYLNQSINSPGSIVFVLNYLGLSPEYAGDILKNRHTSSSFKKSKYAALIDQNVYMIKDHIRDTNLRNNIYLDTEVGDNTVSKVFEEKITDPMIAPLMAEDDKLSEMPFTYIMTCGYDFIRDDGIMFYERLRKIGVRTTLDHYHEAFHNSLFFPHGPLELDVGVRIVQGIVDILKKELYYRLSPQHPFPEPLNDCLDVVEYVLENSDDIGIDSQKIAIGGDSAGGNLAAAISFRLKTKIAMQLVLVPVLQFSNWKNTGQIENVAYLNKSVNSPDSIHFALNYLGVDHKHADDFLNNRHTSISFKKSKYTKLIDQNLWMNKEYIRDEHLRENIVFNINIGDDFLSRQIEGKITDPMVAPLMAEDDMLEDLPYTYIVACGYDFIRDDGIMFYERLRNVGADVTLEHYSEGFHNALMFCHGPLKCDVGVRIVDGIISVLRNELS